MNIEYTQRLQNIEAQLDLWLPKENTPVSETWMKNVFPGLSLTSCPKSVKLDTAFVNSLFTPLNDILSRGGKRWRPLLMTLVCETLGGGEAALPLSPLVEFSHNASLIHDDIEDDSDQRRGKPAIHHLYGVDTAINVGSFFYFMSLCCIESFSGKNKEQIYKLWGEYMRKLHLGQSMDISWHRDITLIPSIDDYYIMCGMKTGALASFAAELGVYAAGASAETAQVLGKAAEKLGIGFQILDDVKNLTAQIPGKKRGDDIVEGKKSLPILLYLHKYPEKRERVYFCFHEAKTKGASVPEVEELIETLTEAGVLTEAEKIAEALVKEARDIFNSPLLDGLIGMIS